jgi:uncharacterized protein YdiU (UPF0061 family)
MKASMKGRKVQIIHILCRLTLLWVALTFFSSDLAIGSEGVWKAILVNEHPLPAALSGGESPFVKFKVKKKPGEIILTNFPLLKELGLLPLDAPNILTEELKKNLLDGFSIEVVESTSDSSSLPFATYYADGGIGFAGGKGDGRALWIAQLSSRHPDRAGMSYDISVKGSGATGLGYTNLPGHSDGMSHVSDALQEYYIGEMFSRLGISDASRIMAVIKTGKKKRLADGTLVDGAIMVRVSPTNLRFAHIWRYGRNPAKLRLLLNYLFTQDRRFSGLSFEEATQRLLEINTETTAREAAILEDFNIAHLSPTRGNRLITGELIDFGTVLQTQVVDWHFYKSIWLGSLWEQKRHLSYWNERLKETLEGLVGRLEYQPAKRFDEIYVKEQQRLNLNRLGFSKREIELLIANHPGLVANINSALETIKRTRTRKRIGARGRRYRRTIFDQRKFISQIPYERFGSNLWAEYFSFENLVEYFGTPFTSHSFKSSPAINALKNLEDQLSEVVGLLSKGTKSNRQLFLKKLSQEASERSQKTLPRSPRSREIRMNEWASAVRSGVSGDELISRIGDEISSVVDFEVSPSKTVNHLNPGELYLGYLIDLNRDLETGEDIDLLSTLFDIPDGILDSNLYKSHLRKYGRQLSPVELDRFISDLYYMVEESQFASVIRMGLEVARKRPDTAMKTIFELIQVFPEEFELDPVDALKGIEDDKVIFSSLPVVKVLRHPTVPNLLIRVMKSNSFVAAEAINVSTNEVVFRDGIRRIYQPNGSKGNVITSSYLVTYTDPGYRNLGLYKTAIEQYTALVPDIELVYLNSENRPTLEFLFFVERALKNASTLSELTDYLFVRDFLSEFSVDIEKLQAGDKSEFEKAVDAFIKLSLQGRVRLKSDLSFDLDRTRFATFKSKILTPLESRRHIQAMTQFETQLSKIIAQGESKPWKSIFPPEYLDQLVMRSSNQSTMSRSCSAHFSRAM